MGFPPGTSRLEVTLVFEGEGTTVRVVHHGLSPAEAVRHARGWAHFLPRLAVAAVGGGLPLPGRHDEVLAACRRQLRPDRLIAAEARGTGFGLERQWSSPSRSRARGRT